MPAPGPDFTVYNSADEALNKTAVLVTGAEEAMLVDGLFTLADAHRVVGLVLDSARTLTRVYVSHGDPDYYFGLQVIRQAFPDVEIVATAETVAHIEHSYEGKLAAWAHLGVNLPTEIIVPDTLQADFLDLEGHRFEVRRVHPELPDRTFLWLPEARAVLGGVLIFNDLHVWTADTPSSKQRAAWVESLDGILALDPQLVVAGHQKADSATTVGAVHFTRDYLIAFEQAIDEATDAAAAKAELVGRYPHAGLAVAVDLGTKVAKGEMTWG